MTERDTEETIAALRAVLDVEWEYRDGGQYVVPVGGGFLCRITPYQKDGGHFAELDIRPSEADPYYLSCNYQGVGRTPVDALVAACVEFDRYIANLAALRPQQSTGRLYTRSDVEAAVESARGEVSKLGMESKNSNDANERGNEYYAAMFALDDVIPALDGEPSPEPMPLKTPDDCSTYTVSLGDREFTFTYAEPPDFAFNSTDIDWIDPATDQNGPTEEPTP